MVSRFRLRSLAEAVVSLTGRPLRPTLERARRQAHRFDLEQRGSRTCGSVLQLHSAWLSEEPIPGIPTLKESEAVVEKSWWVEGVYADRTLGPSGPRHNDGDTCQHETS